jgi:hypothetical protein
VIIRSHGDSLPASTSHFEGGIVVASLSLVLSAEAMSRGWDCKVGIGLLDGRIRSPASSGPARPSRHNKATQTTADEEW